MSNVPYIFEAGGKSDKAPDKDQIYTSIIENFVVLVAALMVSFSI